MLMNKRTQKQICSQVITATTFMQRFKGLIGTKNFADRGMLFKHESWVHTFFMSIPIDVVYLNDKMEIVKIDHSLRPWRLPAPVFKAKHLIELPAGLAKEKQLTLGDELYVGH